MKWRLRLETWTNESGRGGGRLDEEIVQVCGPGSCMIRQVSLDCQYYSTRFVILSCFVVNLAGGAHCQHQHK